MGLRAYLRAGAQPAVQLDSHPAICARARLRPGVHREGVCVLWTLASCGWRAWWLQSLAFTAAGCSCVEGCVSSRQASTSHQGCSALVGALRSPACTCSAAVR